MDGPKTSISFQRRWSCRRSRPASRATTAGADVELVRSRGKRRQSPASPDRFNEASRGGAGVESLGLGRHEVRNESIPFSRPLMQENEADSYRGFSSGRDSTAVWEFVGSSHPEAQSDGPDLEPECGEEVILGSTAVVDSCSTDPTCGGPPPSGDDDTNNQPLEPPSIQPWRGSARVPTHAASMPDGVGRATSRFPGGLCRRHHNRARGSEGASTLIHCRRFWQSAGLHQPQGKAPPTRTSWTETARTVKMGSRNYQVERR